ncbi:MAG: hypothetical protein M0C28_41825 [Candidatus Moduliflexus flocculans]|nr:hypothetical protein [Candidatus Moduliflexus flocculans]
MPASGGFSDNALKILKARYFLKNEKGELLDKSPEDLFRRVATYVATGREVQGRPQEIRPALPPRP